MNNKSTVYLILTEFCALVFFMYLTFFVGHWLSQHWTQVPTVLLCMFICGLIMSLIVPTTASLLGPKQ